MVTAQSGTSATAELEVELAGSEGVKALEGVEAAVEVLVVVAALLALWVHGVLPLVKPTPHLCTQEERTLTHKSEEDTYSTNGRHY